MYIAKIVQNGSNQPQLYYCHTDPLGTIKALTDTNGEVVKTFEHEPFGKESMETGALEEESRFTGKSLDSTGLYYFNARYYNPTIGRFISADPASEGLNLYVYCNNNPLMFVDPDGRRIDDLNQWVSYDADGEVLSSETEIVGDIEYSKQFVEKTETLHITDQRGVKKLEVRKAKNAKYSKVGFEVAVGVMGNYYKLGEIIIISIGVPVQLLDEEHPVVTALKEAKDFNHNNITLVTQYYQWKNFNKESFECEISLSEPQYYLKSEYDGILYNLSISPSEYNKIVGFCK
jgi:RHS repeat-associated protein